MNMTAQSGLQKLTGLGAKMKKHLLKYLPLVVAILVLCGLTIENTPEYQLILFAVAGWQVGTWAGDLGDYLVRQYATE